MARLPQPGADNGTWGDILNDYLSQSHKPTGLLKDDIVTADAIAPNAVTSSALANDAVDATAIADGSITEALLDSALQTKINTAGVPDATTSVKGKVKLAGDLSGTADLPTVATGAITSAKIADGTIVSGDISATAAITKTQLATAVQSSLDKADTALQSATFGGGTLSGFPLRKAGETVVAVAQEIGKVAASSTSPAGSKVVVLAESWDKPGILKHIWMAADSTPDGNGFLELGGTIRIYIDNATTPTVSMPIGDFFCYADQSDLFASRRVGRTSRGNNASSAYRYLHVPFQKYLRVEIQNNTSSDVLFYGQASYSLVDSFSDLGSQQLAYTIKGQRSSSQARKTPVTVCDMNGAGQVESIWISFSGALGDAQNLEGNIEVYVDGESYPSWISSGSEDAFNGGWYNVPVGGYPAGRAGNPDISGDGATMYRFFVDDPIFFSSHIKIVAWAGQPGQANPPSATINYAAYAGIWLNSPTTPNYKAVDIAVSPVFDNQMTQAAGPLNPAVWLQDGSKTPYSATGSTFTIPYDGTSAGQDARATPLNVSLPTDYWVETKARITSTTNAQQEILLAMMGATPDPYFGSALHVQLMRASDNTWSVLVRDDFDWVFTASVGSGRDLTNTWIRLAMKKEGTKVTAYYAFNDAPSPWIPIGVWTASKSGSGFGIATYTAGAEFDYLTVRPLKSVTS